MKSLLVRWFAANVAVLLMTASAQSTEQQWRTAFDAATTHIAKGDFSAAEKVLKSALGLASSFGLRSSQVAMTLNSQAIVHQHLGRPLDAEQYYRQAITIYESTPGAEGLALARVGNNLSRLYLDNGRETEAEKLLRRTLAQRPDALDRPDTEVVRTYEYLSVIVYRRHNYAEAAFFSRKTLEVCQLVLGAEHPETALALNDLGVLEVEERRFAEGIAHLTDAIRILQGTLGQRHPGSVGVLANLGWACARTRQPQRAEPLLREALESAEAVYGPADIRTAEVLSKYADVLRSMNRKAEAHQLRKRSNEIVVRSDRRNPMGLTVDVRSLPK
jgi:tetratricopeptide (TPR) repeat protein